MPNIYQNVMLDNGKLQVTYLAPDAVDEETGAAEITIIEIPHGVIPHELFDELVDQLDQIVDAYRKARRRPPPTISR